MCNSLDVRLSPLKTKPHGNPGTNDFGRCISILKVCLGGLRFFTLQFQNDKKAASSLRSKVKSAGFNFDRRISTNVHLPVLYNKNPIRLTADGIYFLRHRTPFIEQNNNIRHYIQKLLPGYLTTHTETTLIAARFPA